jgi:transposase
MKQRKKEKEILVLESLRKGLSISAACAAAQVGRTTWYRWVEADPTLEERAEEALSVVESRLLALIEEHAVKQWQAAAWILERRFPKRWSLRESAINRVDDNQNSEPQKIVLTWGDEVK